MTWRQYLSEVSESQAQWQMHEGRSNAYIVQAGSEDALYELVREMDLDEPIPANWNHEKDTVVFNGDLWTR